MSTLATLEGDMCDWLDLHFVGRSHHLVQQQDLLKGPSSEDTSMSALKAYTEEEFIHQLREAGLLSEVKPPITGRSVKPRPSGRGYKELGRSRPTGLELPQK